MTGAAMLAIDKVGLLTAVGTSAPSSCAAFRAKVNNPRPTAFMDSTGEWILGHAVELDEEFEGKRRLIAMAKAVVTEVLPDLLSSSPENVPLILCIGEKERPGRLEGLDASLIGQIQTDLNLVFSPDSSVIAEGRVGVASALAQARTLLERGRAAQVLVAATDSLLHWPTIEHYDREGRLLTQDNPNGFMVGEGAGALLVGLPRGGAQLLCTGMGFAQEQSSIGDATPCSGIGLASAIRAAVSDAGLTINDFDFRIADVSGEQYYFKETALALSRTMRQSKEDFDLWHPAECTGEAGALAGVAIIALAHAAAQKGYGPGPNVIAHMSNDNGLRAALTLQFMEA
jgi:3-oxoacyl-[acyl-carrier-protein] synthase I